MQTIKVFPDFCSTGLWNDTGHPVTLDELMIDDPCADLYLVGICKVFTILDGNLPEVYSPLTDDIVAYLNKQYGDYYNFVPRHY